ncbi:uncharacterized protein BDR25DRAFT_97443 [Lindgomyces ingoldianus]|uniref:Uncharacterized protein n=1 Tax=Lindgomyces ingoldianus TaxID=673940 RepID=A0ACB6QB27_9PLEO|nr:uncharacterized protein BDR25DRAFT_97443 [Lindgomyces ingoldianus]KAF2464234.1 hypothetical protein BDR25DRAFT_97443 [Lindgomyces ingoldianus]
MPTRPNNGHYYKYSYSRTENRSPYYRLCFCSHHVCGDICAYNHKGCICKQCCLSPRVPENTRKLLTRGKVYEIAGKYDIDGLKDLSIEKFGTTCEHFWSDAKFSVAPDQAFCTT